MRIETTAKLILTVFEDTVEELPEATVLAAEQYLNSLAPFISPEGNNIGVRIHVSGNTPKVIT